MLAAETVGEKLFNKAMRLIGAAAVAVTRISDRMCI